PGAAVIGLALLSMMPHSASGGEATASDIRAMALNMYHEARGEGEIGMLAVGWVVLNRMADKAYPSTVSEVVYQGCQFSWVCDGRSDRPREPRAWRKALKLAATLLGGAGPDPTRGAMWYHADWVRDPGFGPRVSQVMRIGRHIFYARADRPRPPSEGGPRLLIASR
ncbi:MAG: cell wall hydrolase, partial [Geminicoccaceae bacterium]